MTPLGLPSDTAALLFGAGISDASISASPSTPTHQVEKTTEVKAEVKKEKSKVEQTDISSQLAPPFKEFGAVDFTKTPEVAVKILQLVEVGSRSKKIPKPLRNKITSADNVTSLKLVDTSKKGGKMAASTLQALCTFYPNVTNLQLCNYALPTSSCQALSNFTKVTSLDLTSSKDFIRQDLFLLVQCLPLKSLNLSNTYVYDQVVTVCQEARQLESLTIQRCDITWRGMLSLLQRCESLRALDVSETLEEGIKGKDIKRARAKYPDITIKTSLALQPNTFSKFNRFKGVDLRRNNEQMNDLLQMVNCSLETLPQGLRKIVEQAAPTITALQLSTMVISEKKLIALSNFRNLKSLELIDCIITPKALQMLSQFPKIERLELTKSGGINVDTVTAITALKDLVDLNLSGTLLDGPMILELAKCPNLRRLNISSCPFIKDKEFWNFLEDCHTVGEVHIFGCEKITTLAEISEWAETNKPALRIINDVNCSSFASGSFAPSLAQSAPVVVLDITSQTLSPGVVQYSPLSTPKRGSIQKSRDCPIRFQTILEANKEDPAELMVVEVNLDHGDPKDSSGSDEDEVVGGIRKLSLDEVHEDATPDAVHADDVPADQVHGAVGQDPAQIILAANLKNLTLE